MSVGLGQSLLAICALQANSAVHVVASPAHGMLAAAKPRKHEPRHAGGVLIR